jgi:3-phytase
MRRRRAAAFTLLLVAWAGCSLRQSHLTVDIKAALATQPVADDADDPAIWVHPADPEKSLIIGTNKVAAPTGALVVFNLDGTIRQTISPIDRPNNVDVEYGLTLQGRSVDIAVATERP